MHLPHINRKVVKNFTIAYWFGPVISRKGGAPRSSPFGFTRRQDIPTEATT